MSDSTLDVTQSFDRPQKLLKIIDNGDGTYSVSAALTTALVPKTYDEIVVNYTDATKETISTVVYKLGGTTVATITLTSASTSDTYART